MVLCSGLFSVSHCQAVRARLVDVLFVSPERRGLLVTSRSHVLLVHMLNPVL